MYTLKDKVKISYIKDGVYISYRHELNYSNINILIFKKEVLK